VINKKLGRNVPTNAPAIMYASFKGAKIVIPKPLPFILNLQKIKTWILGDNDKFGVCGPVSIANFLNLLGISVTQEDIFDLYRRSGNPDFDPATGADDNGVVVQNMLNALLTGGIGGHFPAAFVKLNPKNLDEIRDGIQVFKGLIVGVNLEVAQQTQKEWKYKKSRKWGGHCILVGSYTTNPDLMDCISWAELIPMDDTFIEAPGHQVEEVWGVLFKENLNGLTTDEIKTLAIEYQAITGRVFPITV